MSNYVIIQCPHCTEYIQILKSEFNCKIFRHGVLRSNLQQINPHLQKEHCDKLVQECLIFGCGKPFQLIVSNGSYIAVECDYI